MKKPFFVWNVLCLLLAAAAYYGSPAVKTGVIGFLAALCAVFGLVEWYTNRKAVNAAKQLKSLAVLLFVTSAVLLGFGYKKPAPLTLAAAVEKRQEPVIINEITISQVEYPCNRCPTGALSAVTITGVKNFQDFEDELYAHLGLDVTVADSVKGKDNRFTAYLSVPLDTVRQRAKRHWVRLLTAAQ